MKRNILITSVGRRVELIEAFVEAANSLSNSEVFGTDMNPEMSSAGRFVSSCFIVPRANANGYIDKLLEICEDYKIGLIIPTLDTELLALAQNQELFNKAGVSVVISDLELVSKCRDKRLTSILFTELKIPIPKELDLTGKEFPIFGKPISGSLSQGLVTIKNKSEITDEILSKRDEMVFMEYISLSHYDEYTIDAYYDKNSECKCLVPRRRIEVRGGEISKGITNKGPIYSDLVRLLNHVKGARGVLTIQVFAHKKTGHLKGIEINPRFGGGFPLSNAAGAKYAEYIVKEYILDQQIDFYDQWKDKLKMTRYDKAIYF